MVSIVVFGGTGFTGGNVVAEAASRGHQVVSLSRSEPQTPVSGVRYEEGEATRAMLAEEAPAEPDWLFVSPAGSYGAWAAGERTGRYRLGGEVALFDDEGGSTISGGDFAVAIVDEIEAPRHSREHVGIAY
jgi:putative NADH-flavin reductase